MDKETERSARRFQGLDTWGTEELLETLWSGQSRATAACLPALPMLARVVEAAVERLAPGRGRLVYAVLAARPDTVALVVVLVAAAVVALPRNTS